MILSCREAERAGRETLPRHGCRRYPIQNKTNAGRLGFFLLETKSHDALPITLTLSSKSPCLPADKAAFASKRRCVCAVSFLQTGLNVGKPHFAAAFGTGHARHGRVRRLRRYKHAKPSPDVFIEARDALAQFVASRQHDPAALDVEIFGFVDLIGGGGCFRPALPRTFITICDLS